MITNILKPILALAQEGLEVTTQTTRTTSNMSPEEAQKVLTTILAVGLPILIIFAVISLVFTLIWIVALIHAISNDVKNKALWIIGMLLVGPIVSIIYLLTEKKDFEKTHTFSNKSPPLSDAQTPVGVTVVEPIVTAKPNPVNQPPKTLEFKPVEETPPVQN